MTEEKENKPAETQNYERMIRERVQRRAVTLGQPLYESIQKGEENTKTSETVCLSDDVKKADAPKKKE